MSDENLPPYHYWHRNVLLNKYYPRYHIDKFLDHFQFRNNDIVIVTYPRSGTLLTQEIIWQIKHRQSIKAGETYGPLVDRFPYIDLYAEDFEPVDYIDILEKKPENEQRFIKSHLPEHVLFDKIKHCKNIVIVYRDAKDVAASLYNFYQSFPDMNDWPPTWSEFYQYFITGRVFYGSYFKWNVDWLKRRNLPNVHVMKYEDILNNKALEIRRLAVFLDEADITDDQIDIIMRNTSFKSMFADKEVNIIISGHHSIMRKGVIGDHEEYFTTEQKETIESMTETFIKPLEM